MSNTFRYRTFFTLRYKCEGSRANNVRNATVVRFVLQAATRKTSNKLQCQKRVPSVSASQVSFFFKFDFDIFVTSYMPFRFFYFVVQDKKLEKSLPLLLNNRLVSFDRGFEGKNWLELSGVPRPPP